MKEKKENIGISIGSSTVSLVKTENGESRMYQKRHEGKPVSAIEELIKEAGGISGSRAVVAGKNSLKDLRGISEPEAIEKVLSEFDSKDLPEAIVSFGGQTIIAYIIKEKRIVYSYSPNKCGSGTGEFFLQQIKRIGFEGVEDALAAAMKKEAFENPFIPASRCSVFCKSDCTHALNERKATPAQIVAGICYSISQNIMKLLAQTEVKSIWIIGGGSKLQPVISYLHKVGLKAEKPPHATFFEAWGASLIAGDESAERILEKDAFKKIESKFSKLPPLKSFSDLVEYKEMPKAKAESGDKCLWAIDVGSTTTKSVFVRLSDMSIVFSYYGYTRGKPHLAAQENLEQAIKELGVNVEVVGIIVTGSGRYFTETFLTDYSLTDEGGKLIPQIFVANEITCHASASKYFNSAVGTILELGGQDAKYTLLKKDSPIDFAMNEACSAGTGSFMAEVVKELFGINNPADIADVAFKSASPNKFGEQCAAFIESDINTAIGEGGTVEDAVAGLCYSVCFNYLNRVVGNRPIAGPISVQGGTAYNKAFCCALAGVLKMNGILGEGEKILVNSDSGLMGAIGAAIILKAKIDNGEYKPISAKLENLLQRELIEDKPFICGGGGRGERCDYKCEIRRFVIDGKKVLFGGSCGRYDNIRKGREPIEPADYDLTIKRDKMLFKEFSRFNEEKKSAPTVGILGNLFDLSLLPLYSNFFSNLGFRVVLADKNNALYEEGVKKMGAPFCYPVERAYGLLPSLLEKKVDYIFLPHVKGMDSGSSEKKTNQCCPIIQAKPYFLSAAFPKIKDKLLAPVLDFSNSIEKVADEFMNMGKKMGVNVVRTIEAFYLAYEKQMEFEGAKKEEGKKIIERLKNNPKETAIVVFGRPYNAFSSHLGANRGITRKIASLGIHIIPLDFLPLEDEELKKMYWPAGKMIIKGAKFVAKHPQLFPLYLTNFSCGPDSFLNFLFHELIGEKPSLTLEFDGHSANAGFDTRIEAFWDIVANYRKLSTEEKIKEEKRFVPAVLKERNGVIKYKDSDGNTVSLTDPSVNLIFVDMGEWGTEAIASITRSMGIKSTVLPPADEACLQIGRRYSSCKECIPYNLTLGSLKQYIARREKNERTLLFMPDTSGPCRFGMYNQFMRMHVEKYKIPNVAFISLSAESKYAGLGPKFSERAWIAVNTAEAFENMAAALKTLAKDKESANSLLKKKWKEILSVLEKGVELNNFLYFRKLLKKTARELRNIQLIKTLKQTPKILIAGEIYVRKAKFTTEAIVERLTDEGFVVLRSPVSEWVKYNGLLMKKGINPGMKRSLVRDFFERYYEKSIYKVLSGSGLLENHVSDLSKTVNTALKHIDLRLQGEAVLTVGAALTEVFEHVAGVVIIGPFGCMPTRIASSILSYAMTAEEKIKINSNQRIKELGKQFPNPPMIVYEADSSQPSPVFYSQLDVFCLVAKNVGEKMVKNH